MAVTGSITTRFKDEKGLDLGKTLIEKDYLISVYPNIVNQLDTPMLMVCGDNTYGALGDNTTVSKSSMIQTVTFGANWKQVSGNSLNTAVLGAIKINGTLWMWGTNNAGQLGDNTVTKRSSPVQTVALGTNWKQVSCGYNNAGAIKSDGTLWMWGLGSNGTIGDNTGTNRSSPVQTVTGGTNWKQFSCGHTHATAIKNDGTLWCWGQNNLGQLGNNSNTSTSSPIQTIVGGNNWKQVSAGYQNTAAIKNDGTLWCCGKNDKGQLGDNTITDRSSPVQTIALGTNWKQVSSGYKTMAAIKTDGTLWCWGSNFDTGSLAIGGQLGDNTSVTNRSSPVQTIAYGTNWKQVCCGFNHVAAIKTDGTLWVWGSNLYGNLGDNTSTSKSSPIQTVSYGNNWKQVALARWVTFAIKDGDF